MPIREGRIKTCELSAFSNLNSAVNSFEIIKIFQLSTGENRFVNEFLTGRNVGKCTGKTLIFNEPLTFLSYKGKLLDKIQRF